MLQTESSENTAESPKKDVQGSRLVVAFASTDGEHVNQHFGSARKFVVMSFDADSSDVLSNQGFEKQEQDGNEDKLQAKLAWLKSAGVDVLVCAQVGQSAVGQLLKAGVQPIAVDDRPKVSDVLAQLQSDVRAHASWTKRVDNAKHASSERIDSLLDEDWDEE